MTWMETFLHYWSFVQGIHRSPRSPLTSGQYHGFSIFCDANLNKRSLMCHVQCLISIFVCHFIQNIEWMSFLSENIWRLSSRLAINTKLSSFIFTFNDTIDHPDQLYIQWIFIMQFKLHYIPPVPSTYPLWGVSSSLVQRKMITSFDIIHVSVITGDFLYNAVKYNATM